MMTNYVNFISSKMISETNYLGGGNLQAFELLKIFHWYEWIVVFAFIIGIFIHFEKHFTLDIDNNEDKKE